MRRTSWSVALTLTALLIAITFISCAKKTQAPKEPVITMVIHGGAGTILKETMTPEREKAYRDKLTEALDAGMAVLSKDGSSLDAVEAAIRIMEDSPLFNAGKGLSRRWHGAHSFC